MAKSFTNYPNPFAAGRDNTTVTFFLDSPSRVTLQVFTLWGKPVKTLLNSAPFQPGLHQTVKWDGKNGDGDVVNNGVYYMVLEVNETGGQNIEQKRKVGVIR